MSRIIGNPLSIELQTRLRARHNKVGMTKLAEETRLTRPTLSRILAGLPVQPGTAALIREWAAQPEPLEVENAP